jgi:hypothetical protein
LEASDPQANFAINLPRTGAQCNQAKWEFPPSPWVHLL